MSDLLTHWAAFDDSRRIAAADEQVEPLFNRILDEKADYARLGALARKGSRWMPHLMREAQPQRERLPGDERAQQRLAFALGGLLHFPADHVFKPMMSRLARADWHSAHKQMQQGEADSPDVVSVREISAYYDCHVFRKVYLSGHEEPFSRFLVEGNDTAPGQALEQFVRALFQRALLSSHTLAPDMNNFDEWLDNLLAKIQPLYIDVGLYVRVFEHPDSQKQETFKVETEFYRDDDPLIGLARALQNGEKPDGDAVEAALSPDANRSGYAECLRLGVNLLREATRYWRGQQPDLPDVRQGLKGK